MAEIIPFPARALDYTSPWRLLLITAELGGYVVRAWTMHPADEGAGCMTVGFESSLQQAAEVARLKGLRLGISEIVDLSSVDVPDDAA